MVTVNGRQQAITLLVHGAIVVIIVAAATVLAALKDLDAQAYTAIIGTSMGLVGGSAGSLAIVGFSGNGKNGNGASTTPPTAAPEQGA